MTEIKTSPIGAENGHWYNANGLVTSVPSADGKKLLTSISAKHAKKFGLVPSVTSVLSVVAKPALTSWKIKEHIRACAVVGPQEKNEPFEQYCMRVAKQMNRYNDHAAMGSDIHANIGKWFQNFFSGKKYNIDPVAAKCCKWLETQFREINKLSPNTAACESEKPFANFKLGFGGTVDWKFVAENMVALVDFKTTDDDKLALGPKLARKDSHLAQLVAYDAGTNINPSAAIRKYINVFIGRLGGDIYVHEWTNQDDINWAREYFFACLNLFKILKGLN